MNNFDDFAKEYRHIHDDNLKSSGYTSDYFVQRKIREISNHTPELSNKTVSILDLGCGDGLGALYFKKYFPTATVKGIDISSKSIAVATARGVVDAEFRRYDGKKIPFSDHSFDIILVAGVMHHLEKDDDKANLLQECSRVLTSQGRLFIFEHNPLNPLTKKIVSDCVFDHDAKLVSLGKMRALTVKAGFSIRMRFIIFFPGILKKLEFIEKIMWWIPFGGQYYIICQKR